MFFLFSETTILYRANKKYYTAPLFVSGINFLLHRTLCYTRIPQPNYFYYTTPPHLLPSCLDSGKTSSSQITTQKLKRYLKKLNVESEHHRECLNIAPNCQMSEKWLAHKMYGNSLSQDFLNIVSKVPKLLQLAKESQKTSEGGPECTKKIGT